MRPEMSYQTVIRTLLNYHVVSNRRLWEHLLAHLTDEQFIQPVDYAFGSIRSQVVHMAATDRYWLHDIQSKPITGLEPEDFPTRASFSPMWESIQGSLLAYVGSLTGRDLAEAPGGLMETRWEALVHVANHGTDHRAQVLSMLHTMGVPTFEQDFADHLRRERQVTKTRVVDQIRYWHSQWEQALEAIPHEKLTEPVLGEWSVKDLITHLTWYERQMVETIHGRAVSVSEPADYPRDQLNQQIFEQHRSQSLDEARRDQRQVQRQLLQAVEQLEDQDLNDPTRIRGLPSEKKLWELLESRIWVHYMIHTEDLWALLDHSSS
jgi:uncharacterized damage-inducible protein DinB